MPAVPPCRSLAQVLECIKACARGRPIELLRKESVASLPPAAAFRILGHSYSVVLPVTSLPFPPLPLSLQRPGAWRAGGGGLGAEQEQCSRAWAAAPQSMHASRLVPGALPGNGCLAGRREHHSERDPGA